MSIPVLCRKVAARRRRPRQCPRAIGPGLRLGDALARQFAPLGIVYDSDVRAEPKVKVVARFPDTSHPPIIYPAALTRASVSPDAARFLQTLRMPASAAVFAREGFVPLD